MKQALIAHYLYLIPKVDPELKPENYEEELGFFP
jgi:hypothetical protein